LPEQSQFETYSSLRLRALNVRAQDLGFADLAPNAPYGAVMELNMDNGIVTLTSFLSGDASLYSTTGAGIIGGIKYEAISSSARNFVEVAARFTSGMSSTNTFPYPATGMVRFYVLTPATKLTCEEWNDDLEKDNSEFSELFHAAHSVITAFRPLLLEGISRQDTK
jgi:hypothetical protein